MTGLHQRDARPARYRQVLGHFATGVTVVTDGGRCAGGGCWTNDTADRQAA